MLDEWVAGVAGSETAEKLDAAGAPYGVVESMHQAVDHPYFAERDMIVEVSDPGGGRLRVVSSPLFCSDAPSGGVPLAGEHTNEILQELGYNGASVSAMVESGLVEVARGAKP